MYESITDKNYSSELKEIIYSLISPVLNIIYYLLFINYYLYILIFKGWK
jgi:hypothetical protein